MSRVLYRVLTHSHCLVNLFFGMIPVRAFLQLKAAFGSNELPNPLMASQLSITIQTEIKIYLITM